MASGDVDPGAGTSIRLRGRADCPRSRPSADTSVRLRAAGPRFRPWTGANVKAIAKAKKNLSPEEYEQYLNEITFKMMDLAISPGLTATEKHIVNSFFAPKPKQATLLNIPLGQSTGDFTITQVQSIDGYFAPKPTIFNVPLEIIEGICTYLDPLSLAFFKRTHPIITEKVFGAFCENTEQKYFFNQCLNQINPNSTIFPKITKSFTVAIGKHNVLAYAGIPKHQDSYDWKSAYYSYYGYLQVLKSHRVASIKPHAHMERWKTETLNGFGIDNLTHKHPFKWYSTFGSGFARFTDPPSVPTDMGHAWLHEDLVHLARREYVHVGSGNGDKILTVELWELLDVINQDLHSGQMIQATSTPSVEFVFVILTLWSLVIYPTNIGKPATIKLDRINHAHFHTDHRSTPPYVVNDSGFLGIWITPTHFRLYKVTLEPITRDAKLTVLQNVLVGQQMHLYWQKAFTRPMEFMSILKNSPAAANAKASNVNLDQCQSDWPEYSMISPTHQNITLKFDSRGPKLPIPGSINEIGVGGTLSLQTPSYCAGTLPLKFLEHDPIEGRTKGHKRVLFWSSKAAHFLVRPSDLWISGQWPRCITHPKGIPNKITVIEIIDISHLLIGTANGYIYVVMFKMLYPRQRTEDENWWYKTEEGTHDEGRVDFEVCRKIDLTAQLPKVPLQIRLDFWTGGLPYIFTVCDYELENLNSNTGDRTPLSYEPLLIEFEAVKIPKRHTKVDPEILERLFLRKLPKVSPEPKEMTQEMIENVKRHKEYLFL